MKQYRENTFETNSSSSHSIVISEQPNFNYTIVPNQDGIIIIDGEDFGWDDGYGAHDDAMSKAEYCAQDQYTNPDNMDMLKKVIMEHTGATDVIFRGQEDCFLDHQSQGTTWPAFNDEETLKTFLFDSDSTFKIDNDNH
ncbi:MAG: hypothetical protein H8D23_11090 [Candidatus Brocadiales bacterium]|nr:hypothetical protein [Candidatus Brocadiales bacterium]